MNRVTGSVAHEIKNPLNSIAIRLDNLQAWATNKFPEAEKEILHIFEEVNRLDRVVRTFLDFTRPVTLSMQKVDVVALAQHVTEMMMPDAARRNVEARFSSEREALFVEGDRDRLEQAIINLVANGIEAMPEGGSLTVEVEKSGASAPSWSRTQALAFRRRLARKCSTSISRPRGMAQGLAFQWHFKPSNSTEEPSTSIANQEKERHFT